MTDTRDTSLDETIIEGPLYASAKKVYPQSVHGLFRQLKWIILFVCLGVYYLLPFVRWDRGPNLPNQAVLLDLDKGRFYFFFIEIWPQEVYYFTGLLVISAILLFLMNAVAGRIWCGYLCPQTVWSDLFLAVEARVEGDRRDRIKLDAEPWHAQKIIKKLIKHLLWLMIAWWTGGAWVLYFSDAPKLVKDLVLFQAPLAAYVWIGILTATTYILAGHMREQVCLYMCPWPRIQAALTDEHALNVAYRYSRGEPRMSVKQAAKAKLEGAAAGDCVDCLQCVNVCPTGVDIREGSQMGCIQCGLCIDACTNIMEKLGRPTGLIAYDSELALEARAKGEVPVYKMIRARTVLYAVIIALIGGGMVWKLWTRSSSDISILHERTPLFVTLSDGSIRNAYTMRLINKRPDSRQFAITVRGPLGAVVEVVGIPATVDWRPLVDVGPDQTREVRVLVTVPKGTKLEKTQAVQFRANDLYVGEGVVVEDHFFAPER